MDVNERLPALRPLDVMHVEGDDGEAQFVLRDRMGIAPQALAVSVPGYFVMAHLDGQHTCADVQAAFAEQLGMQLPTEQVVNMIETLDAACLLQNERFEEAYAKVRDAYLAAPARDNRERYPDADTLRSELQQIVEAGTPARVRRVSGIIAPHLDYARGAPCYADAYATLARFGPADRYVILGTNHGGRATGTVSTRKDFQTPLGVAPVDRDLIATLEQHLGEPLCTYELDHQFEHSIELQVHFVQLINDGQPFEILPLLCQEPQGESAPAGGGPDIERVGDALAALLADDDRRTVIIAGADLSHIGQHFGDEEPATPELLEEVGKLDQQLLSLVASHREEHFASMVQACENPTRICSVGCIYGLLRALPTRKCRILRYHQATDYENDVHVTCAAGVVN